MGGARPAFSRCLFDSRQLNMMKPRISLRSLFVGGTLLIVLFGYSQLRRKRILEMCEGLRRDGYTFETPNELRDWVWQRKPLIAIFYELDGESFLELTTPTASTSAPSITAVTPKELRRRKSFGVVQEVSEETARQLKEDFADPFSM